LINDSNKTTHIEFLVLSLFFSPDASHVRTRNKRRVEEYILMIINCCKEKKGKFMVEFCVCEKTTYITANLQYYFIFEAHIVGKTPIVSFLINNTKC
jgi:hypothetical protein